MRGYMKLYKLKRSILCGKKRLKDLLGRATEIDRTQSSSMHRLWPRFNQFYHPNTESGCWSECFPSKNVSQSRGRQGERRTLRDFTSFDARLSFDLATSTSLFPPFLLKMETPTPTPPPASSPTPTPPTSTPIVPVIPPTSTPLAPAKALAPKPPPNFTGIPSFSLPKKLPSKNWFIFAAVVTIPTYLWYDDRQKAKALKQRYLERVAYLSTLPMEGGALGRVRTATVYASRWPGEEDGKAAAWWKRYVKVSL